MAITRPALRGTMGSTTYYEITMTARELTNSVRPARETDAWASASIDERIQREVNRSRVMSTIVPYLAQHPDRFFGSFIVLVPKGAVEFEPLTDLVEQAPGRVPELQSRTSATSTIDKGELIALDGQHRLLAFREVIQGGTNLGPLWAEVGDDEVCVLLARGRVAAEDPAHLQQGQPARQADRAQRQHHHQRGRRLRPRYSSPPRHRPGRAASRRAQSTTSSTSPSTGRATRCSRRPAKLTTISAVLRERPGHPELYEGYKGFSEKESPIAPDEDTLDSAYEKAAPGGRTSSRWTPSNAALKDPSTIPNVRFDATTRTPLLMRPVGQMALVKGLVSRPQASNGASPPSRSGPAGQQAGLLLPSVEHVARHHRPCRRSHGCPQGGVRPGRATDRIHDRRRLS